MLSSGMSMQLAEKALTWSKFICELPSSRLLIFPTIVSKLNAKEDSFFSWIFRYSLFSLLLSSTSLLMSYTSLLTYILTADSSADILSLTSFFSS